MDESLLKLAIELIAFFFSVLLLWIIIRSGVTAAIDKKLVRQNELILDHLALQTKLLSTIADRTYDGDNLPPPPAARSARF